MDSYACVLQTVFFMVVLGVLIRLAFQFFGEVKLKLTSTQTLVPVRNNKNVNEDGKYFSIECAKSESYVYDMARHFTSYNLLFLKP